jgi:hypothetical protein
MTDDGPASWAEFHFARIQYKPARDAIRKAAREAKCGPVWIVNSGGERVAAIVSVAEAEQLQAERRQTALSPGTASGRE